MVVKGTGPKGLEVHVRRAKRTPSTSATTKSEKGGRFRRWFKTAKVMASITYGTTILNI